MEGRYGGIFNGDKAEIHAVFTGQILMSSDPAHPFEAPRQKRTIEGTGRVTPVSSYHLASTLQL
jgi:hypothetical protein